MPLGVKLKELRIRRRQSLQDVADAVKASKAYIWSLETNQEANPSMEFLTRLATHFRVSVEDIIDEPATASKGQGEMEKMFRDLKTFHEDDLKIVKSVVETIKQKAKATPRK